MFLRAVIMAEAMHRFRGRDQEVFGSPVNAMSIDVEDFFQVQALADCYPRADWARMESRVERNMDEILALLAENNVKATCFTLGWIAERHPALVRRIVNEGHELASHGYEHVRADAQDRATFRADVGRTRKVLEDIGGVPVRGYRAATFSIGSANLWAFDALEEEGYSYSSSIYPISHDNYGMPDAPREPFRPIGGSDFLEIPMSTVVLAGRNLPASGGGFFRLLPYVCSRWAVRRVNERDGRPLIFYFHPWEIDPDQPRPGGVAMKNRVRHYLHLSRMLPRLRRLLGDFRWDRMDRVFLPDAG